MKYCLVFVLTLIFSLPSKANIPIHYLPTEDPGDSRLVYILELLKLSLSKSAPNESIEFIPLPAVISYARAIHEMKRDVYPNYFTPGGVNIELLGTDNLQAVDFPLDHGLLSYRICFVSPHAKQKVAQVKSIDELRQFTIAQGTNWPDVSILKANGFKVIEVPLYTSLFKMVVSNRVELVCRGMNELRSELSQFKHYGKLTYDNSFVLIYTMPYKLYFNKSSAELIAKIELGLAMAKQDGSLDKLFTSYFSEDLAFAKLHQRRQFILTTGYEDSFSENYKQYLYNPFQ
jgi:Bacterial extracellular solute-binding proteins, family 3